MFNSIAPFVRCAVMLLVSATLLLIGSTVGCKHAPENAAAPIHVFLHAQDGWLISANLNGRSDLRFLLKP
jgi:hypothetical protein